MKKPLFILFSALTVSSICNAQNNNNFRNDSVKRYVDTTLLIIHNNALNRKKTNWDLLESDIYGRTKAAQSIEEILPIYSYIFQKIEDHHGWLSYKDKTYRWNTPSNGFKNEIVKKAISKYEKVYATILKGNIGYLRIPGNSDFSASKMDSIAANIVDEINKVNTGKINGWILDFRLNTGGNMYPMISGVSDFLGTSGKFGSFVTAAGKKDGEWILKNGNIYIDSNQVLNRGKLKKPIKKDIPLVLLISSYTASSGEMTAIAIIGRAKTKVFGEPSAGYTTTNQGFKIDNNSGLNLAVGFVTDRTGKLYNDSIKPDITIWGGDNFEALASDSKIVYSLKWFKKEIIGRY